MPHPSLQGQLEKLRELIRLGHGDQALALARQLRPAWKLFFDAAAAKGGRSGGRSMLRRLFKLGLFDEPPLSGEPYAAWRLLRELTAPAASVASAVSVAPGASGVPAPAASAASSSAPASDVSLAAPGASVAPDVPAPSSSGAPSSALASSVPPVSSEASPAAGLSAASPALGAASAAPFFSLLMPVYNPVPEHLDAALHSVRAQEFQAWELCAADDASPDPAVRDILARHAEADPRIRVLLRPENGHISAASNSALEMARAPWCVLLDHDDLLPPEALGAMHDAIAAQPQALVLFSDEDRAEQEPAPAASAPFATPAALANQGRAAASAPSIPSDPSDQGRAAPAAPAFTSPLFKHGFDPDLFLACNCVSHLGVYRTDALRDIGGFRPGYEGGQDYDLALRLLRKHGQAAFCHVPQVLYHWRMHPGSTSSGLEAKPYARDAALKAREDYARSLQTEAQSRPHFTLRPGSGFVDVHFTLPQKPSLTLILLGGEGGKAARRWRERTDASLFASLDIVNLPKGEGLAQACNQAAEKSANAVLAFAVATDTPRAPDWAGRALGALWRDDVAAVGCRAVNEQGFLLQAGYALGREPLSLSASLFGALGGADEQASSAEASAHSVVSTGAANASTPFASNVDAADASAHSASNMGAVNASVHSAVSAGATEASANSSLNVGAANASAHAASNVGAADGFWLCPAYAGLHETSAGYYSQAQLLHSVPALYLSGLFLRRDIFLQLGGFRAEYGNLFAADFCLRAWRDLGRRSVITPGADLLGSQIPRPEPANPNFRREWPELAQGHPPFQHPHLDWTPGGWRLRG